MILQRCLTWAMSAAGGEERAFFIWDANILIIRKRGFGANLELERYEFPTEESACNSMIAATAALEGNGYLLSIEPVVVDVTEVDVQNMIKGDENTLLEEMFDLVMIAKVAV